jgi:U3 small nucleolar ribonucleoprotein protein IMP4
MLRRNARERREFLYKKSLQQEERERLDRKIRVREALEKGTPIAEEDLRMETEEKEYGFHQLFEMNQKEKKELEIDNEYTNAGKNDPKILLTTSIDPSDRLKRFTKEVKFLFPNCQRINRGGQQLKELVEVAIQSGFTDLIFIHENKGEPDGLVISHLPHGPTAHFSMFNTVMRHEVLKLSEEKMPQQYPHLIFHNFKTKLGERVATILKYLFPIPKNDSTRVITFANQNDFISFRHHIYHLNSSFNNSSSNGNTGNNTSNNGNVELKEIGPRFELQLYQIQLGIVSDKTAETEWVLRPYMNTASKRQALGISNSDLKDESSESNLIQTKY